MVSQRISGCSSRRHNCLLLQGQQDGWRASSLKGSVLGHFATQDEWINEQMVSGFESAMDVAEKSYTTYWYDAQHAFANPTSARYDAGDAALAWQGTLEFLSRYLDS